MHISTVRRQTKNPVSHQSSRVYLNIDVAKRVLFCPTSNMQDTNRAEGHFFGVNFFTEGYKNTWYTSEVVDA